MSTLNSEPIIANKTNYKDSVFEIGFLLKRNRHSLNTSIRGVCAKVWFENNMDSI